MSMVNGGDDDTPITRKEINLTHLAHTHEHEVNDKAIETALNSVDKLAVIHAEAHAREHAAHAREHDLHDRFHDAEHKMTEAALHKADAALDQRLEGMNEFRAQLEKQAGAFLTREMFDSYTKEQGTKTELALKNTTEKYDGIISAIVSRHDSDFETIRESIQAEREYRKSYEGSMNTWKWIASFLGASGVAGVILLFITRLTG